MRRILLLAAIALAPVPASADPATVEDVTLYRTGAAWTVSVTIRHGDTGWDDYADGWRVEAPDGTVVGTRELLHPHVEEQPFTRSLSGVEVPPGLSSVMIRTRTNVTGWAENVYGPVALPAVD
jgi:hypothetical protein